MQKPSLASIAAGEDIILEVSENSQNSESIRSEFFHAVDGLVVWYFQKQEVQFF